jgi:ribonuclease HI
MYLTFGKYSGKTVEVVSTDAQYSRWLISQPWFSIKHADMYGYLIKELNDPLICEKTIRQPKTENSFIVYTDGACKNNGQKKAKAGIGIHFSKTNKIQIEDVSEKLIYTKQTNNAAELMAILKCLELCHVFLVKEKIYLYTDSEYSLKCITIWYPEWLNNNKCQGKKNIDILHKINNLYQLLDVELIHIRAHTGLRDIHSLGNEMADKLAVQSIS